MLKAIRIDESTDKHVLADWFESFAAALRDGRATPAIGTPAGVVTKFGRVWAVNVNAEFLDTTPDEPAQKCAFQKAMAGTRSRAGRHVEAKRDAERARTPHAPAKRSQESAIGRSRNA